MNIDTGNQLSWDPVGHPVITTRNLEDIPMTSLRWARHILPCAMALLCLSLTAVHAQTDTISGVVNRYTRLTWIECTGRSVIEVDDPYGFKADDRILIIQMCGASIDTRDSSVFGSVTSYNDAGHYELATVDEIHGKMFTLKYELARTYTLSEVVQVIRVPVYTNVVVAGTVRPKVWNDTTGGVVAFIATGTVTMNANIDASGAGFRGVLSRAPDTYWYTVMGHTVSPVGPGVLSYFNSIGKVDSGSIKGEGIHKPQQWYLCGRGSLGNAGGGGNAEESGGGGGGNAGAGGNGGKDRTSITNGGVGGQALMYSNMERRVFMGGSGGSAGPNEELFPLGGENGGGIVLIRANQLDGNGHSILANGADEPVRDPDYTLSGGGGAAGVILLDIGSFSDSVFVNANGGKGGDVVDYCTHGPGGGGGGGCVWFSGGSSTPTNVRRTVDGGGAGINDPGGCGGSTYGATPGTPGVVLTDYEIPEGSVPR